MVITWHGLSCFKIEINDLVIGISPFAKNEKLGIQRAPRFKAQALLLSSPDELYSYTGSIDGKSNLPATLDSGGGSSAGSLPGPIVFDSPGEYELSGSFIYGIPGQAKSAKARDRKNTIFVIKSEDIWLAHLGAFSGSSVSDEALEKLQGVDILFLPIGGKSNLSAAFDSGGKNVCDATQAASLVTQIGPKIIIPMHYDFLGSKMKLDSLDKFVKEINLKPEEMDKLSIRSSPTDEEKTRLVVLKSQTL
jgi:L-ascorbate metabolism protein UlaG (beta-lactamase superfamily)